MEKTDAGETSVAVIWRKTSWENICDAGTRRRGIDNVVYVNFENDQKIATYFRNDIKPDYIIRILEQYYHTAIIPDCTLIIFDEIQLCERALTSLKYFAEEAPEYHVIAAGSLLGVAIKRERFSFPVGKVQMLTMYPMDFEEYLWASITHTK